MYVRGVLADVLGCGCALGGGVPGADVLGVLVGVLGVDVFARIHLGRCTCVCAPGQMHLRVYAGIGALACRHLGTYSHLGCMSSGVYMQSGVHVLGCVRTLC